MKKTSHEDNYVHFPFYPHNWTGSEELALCSLETHGFWINCLARMWYSPIRGKLLKPNKEKYTIEQLAKTLRTTPEIVNRCLTELSSNNEGEKMGKTTISWTERTWNPVSGCTKVSDGCKFCYAERIADRFWGDRKFTDIQCHEDRLDIPLHWRKPSMIFVNSMSDLFHEKVPFEFIDGVFATMFDSPWHTFQILTKRPKRMLEWYQKSFIGKNPDGFAFSDFWGKEIPKHIWIGVSVENQKTADERIPILLQCPAKVHFISAEPLLEKINISRYLIPMMQDEFEYDAKNPPPVNKYGLVNPLDWVIGGCESGTKRRKAESEWFTNLKWQCKASSVPYFMKQMEVNKVTEDMSKFPADLRVREYPQ